jgi:hypothetical protein
VSKGRKVLSDGFETIWSEIVGYYTFILASCTHKNHKEVFKVTGH